MALSLTDFKAGWKRRDVLGHTNIQATVRVTPVNAQWNQDSQHRLPGHIWRPASVLHVGSVHLQQNTYLRRDDLRLTVYDTAAYCVTHHVSS